MLMNFYKSVPQFVKRNWESIVELCIIKNLIPKGNKNNVVSYNGTVFLYTYEYLVFDAVFMLLDAFKEKEKLVGWLIIICYQCESFSNVFEHYVKTSGCLESLFAVLYIYFYDTWINFLWSYDSHSCEMVYHFIWSIYLWHKVIIIGSIIFSLYEWLPLPFQQHAYLKWWSFRLSVCLHTTTEPFSCQKCAFFLCSRANTFKNSTQNFFLYWVFSSNTIIKIIV